MNLYKKIQCQNDLCVYSNNKQCILDSVELNELGNCNNFVVVKIPTHLIDLYKNQDLRDYETRDNV